MTYLLTFEIYLTNGRSGMIKRGENMTIKYLHVDNLCNCIFTMYLPETCYVVYNILIWFSNSKHYVDYLCPLSK